MPSAPVIRAAGAVLWRHAADGTVEYAVVHRPTRADWSLPKGKLVAGEHTVAAAVREVREETGYAVTLGPALTTLRYPVEGQRKQVRYWSACADDLVPSPRTAPETEVDDLVWLPLERASRLLTYPHDARLLREVAKAPLRTVPLVLLRHAKAVKRAAWSGSDTDRPLAARGVDESRRLVPLLGAFGVTTLVSSDAARCLETVRPYAQDRDLAPSGVRADHWLSEEGHADSPKRTRRLAAELLADPAPLAVCSHRPVLPDLLAELLAGWRGTPARPLAPGAFLVLHRDLSGPAPRVVAVERHRP